MRQSFYLIATICGLLLIPCTSMAQMQGGGGGGSSMGGSSMGGGSTGGSSASRSVGSSSRSVGGGVSAGQRTMTGSNRGRGSTTQSQGNVGQVTGNERFLRENRRGGQFVGADSGDSTNFFSALGAMNNDFGQALQRGMNRNGNQGNQQRRSRRQTMPYRLEVGFASTRNTAPIQRNVTSLTRRLNDPRRMSVTSPVQIELQGRTAILRGAVATDHDRELCEQLARLEPGIDAIQNELTIRSEGTSSAPAADSQ